MCVCSRVVVTFQQTNDKIRELGCSSCLLSTALDSKPVISQYALTLCISVSVLICIIEYMFNEVVVEICVCVVHYVDNLLSMSTVVELEQTELGSSSCLITSEITIDLQILFRIRLAQLAWFVVQLKQSECPAFFAQSSACNRN